MNVKRVFIVQDIVPNYRVPIFRRIADLNYVDLTVFYSDPARDMVAENLGNSNNLDGFRSIKLRLWDRGVDASYQLGLLWYILRERPAVVIAGGAGRLDRFLALLLCKLIGSRFLWLWGGVPFKDPKKIIEYARRGRINRWFGTNNPRWWLIKQAQGLIAYSQHARDYYVGLGFPPSKVWVAPNSPDTDRLRRLEMQFMLQPETIRELRTRFAPNGERIVLTLGRLNKPRQLDVLLRALVTIQMHCPDTALVIIGDGGERPELEHLASLLELRNVYFVGAIYDDLELAKYFLIADVFVTPGISSLAIKMAMSFGLPVITADFGLEVHDVADGINGFVFQRDAVEELSNILIRLLVDEHLRQVVGEAARRTIIQDINIERMVSGFSNAIIGVQDDFPSG